MEASKIRRTIKGQLTRIENFINERSDDASEFELRVRLEKLPALFDRFTSTQDDIELKSNADNLPNEELERENFENRFYTLEAKYKSQIQAKLRAVESTASVNNNRPVVENQNRLPPISLPKFDGQVGTWYSFHDTFLSLVHSDTVMDPIRKFHYLKSCLSGEAANVINSMTVNGDNYNNAWNVLIERYNNKKLLVNHHLKGLFSPSAIKQENHIELKSLLDNTNKNLRGLSSLEIPIDQWDPILIYIVSSKFDSETRRQWDMLLKNDALPTFKELEEFINKRCFALSNSQSSQSVPKLSKNEKLVSHHSTFDSGKNFFCSFCKSSEHRPFKCQDLIKLKPKDRYNLVKRKNLCLKCFGSSHTSNDCKSFDCKICKQKHNSLLHFNNEEVTQENPETVVSTSVRSNNQVILATALVTVTDSQGKKHLCRALLDSGSESSFITEKLAERLHLKLRKSNITISGVNLASSKSFFETNCEISSSIQDYKKNLQFLVTKNITKSLPSAPIDIKKWSFLENYSLADPYFHVPGKIDMLIGAELYEDVYLPESWKPSPSLPSLRSTVFGWIVIGKIELCKNISELRDINALHSTCDLSETIRKFWEIEEITNEGLNNNKFCEKFFNETTKQLSSGRFQVRLPFEPSLESKLLGESRHIALRSLLSMEKRRKSNTNLNEKYVKFMREYEELGHMEKISENEVNLDSEKTFYLPHHAVFKKTGDTTKIRVVFNGSAKSSNGKSLNDILALGPINQDDLFSLLCRFRLYPIALVADVEKMYRQISIAPEDRNYCRILWRYSPHEPISVYRLTTVTYGTKPASFLAIRALHQLGYNNEKDYPVAAKAILKDFYVDNLVTGCFNLNEAKELQKNLIEITNKGCMPLRQWCSNRNELVANLPGNIVESINFTADSQESIPMLGLRWFPIQDVFCYTTNFSNNRPTKRNILSDISRIFDPLGFLSPIIVKCKILMQELWLTKSGWDEPLNDKLLQVWRTLENDFNDLALIKIPRYISGQVKAKKYVIHVFSDASRVAYATVVYLVPIGTNEKTESNVLCSKSKVAPLKPVTIPRLELCGIVLSAQLIRKLSSTLSIDISHVFVWSDSQIALYWVKSPARNWKTFVSNRVALIHELLTPFDYSWHYVPSSENPADLASRGTTIKQLIKNELWWHGPSWINDKHLWPKNNTDLNFNVNQEARLNPICLFSQLDKDYFNDKFSSFDKSIRIFAYCLRYIRKLRGEKFQDSLTSNEYRRSLNALVKLHQSKHFSLEISHLSTGKSLSKKSKLLSLNPFMDTDGLLRVGGRLHNANLPFNQKHPIVLEQRDQLTYNIIDYYHLKYFHAGCQLLRNLITKDYWILGAKSVIKKRIYNCMTCIRLKAETSKQLMGNLPAYRLQPSRPFERVGVDYAGPFLIKRSKGRCNVTEKAYISLIICFTTKALHLELVSDLTTDAFVAALRRFISRRGRPTDIFSDNGKNFLGAKNAFDELREFFQKSSNKNCISQFATSEMINWHFLPPYAPHMGGLWEAGVKSVKTALKSLTSEVKFTFEEFYTIITEVEACLNSRPLTELKNSPDDLDVLTPGHFLIGAPLCALPQSDSTSEIISPLKRWELVKQVSQGFWKRWTGEYLRTLQSRIKWKSLLDNLKVGDLVFIKSDFNVPLKWPLGRVVKVHPGNDKLVRVVTLKTTSGLVKRSLRQLILLPFSVDPDQLGGLCLRS